MSVLQPSKEQKRMDFTKLDLSLKVKKIQWASASRRCERNFIKRGSPVRRGARLWMRTARR